MDKAALVAADSATGARILEILDNAALGISVALWLNDPEYGDWRLVLASRRFDQTEPSKAYGLIHDALENAGLPLEHTPPLLVLRMNDPFIRTLRQTFTKAKNVEGMRLGGQLMGDRFMEDALVYRVR